jgi:subtilase family protein
VKGGEPPVHACNPHRPGDLILGVHREDKLGGELIAQGRERGLPGLEEVEERSSLERVVAALREGQGEMGEFEGEGEPPRFAVEGSYEFRLLEVPEGEEHTAASSLIDLRLRLGSEFGERGSPRVIAQPNHFLDHDSPRSPDRLSADHQRYLKEIGIPPGGLRGRPRVRVIDSGYSGPASVVVKANLLDGNADVSDDYGHGSLVTSIIDDCATGDFEIFKVSSLNRRPSEWEVIQALSIGPLPPIVNVSLSLGFGRTSCSRCGRQSVSARTGTFEARLEELADAGVTVVVAAGNKAAADLAYPSRFHSTVAVEAWSGAPPRLAPYSNCDSASGARGSHPNVFLCPGGDSTANEGPGLDAAGDSVDGTSFATAYMSGLLAASWGGFSVCTGGCPTCRAKTLAIAQGDADRSFAGYDPAEHGHGLARLRSATTTGLGDAI